MKKRKQIYKGNMQNSYFAAFTLLTKVPCDGPVKREYSLKLQGYLFSLLFREYFFVSVQSNLLSKTPVALLTTVGII